MQHSYVHAGEPGQSNVHTGNNILAAKYALYECFDSTDCKCGCVRPLVKEPTRGSSHVRRRKPVGKENVQPERRSKRCKMAVQYCEDSDCDDISAADAASAHEGAEPAANYSVPQCTAHGRQQQRGVARAVRAVQQQIAGSNFKVVLEWPVALTSPKCNGVDRANGKARRGDQKGRSNGQWMSGQRHKVDIVVAQQEGDQLVALSGLEVQGTSHDNAWTKLSDAQKVQLAGFPLKQWSAGMPNAQESLSKAVTCVVRDARLCSGQNRAHQEQVPADAGCRIERLGEALLD